MIRKSGRRCSEKVMLQPDITSELSRSRGPSQPETNARAASRPPSLFLGHGWLGRDHRDDLHVVRVDDHHLVFIDEIEETAPRRLDAHKRLGDRDDMDPAARNHRSDSDVKVDVSDPRCTVSVDDGAADFGALLICQPHVHAGGVALQAFHAGAAAFRIRIPAAGAVLLLGGGAARAVLLFGSGIAVAATLGGILTALVLTL